MLRKRLLDPPKRRNPRRLTLRRLRLMSRMKILEPRRMMKKTLQPKMTKMMMMLRKSRLKPRRLSVPMVLPTGRLKMARSIMKTATLSERWLTAR